MPSFTILRVRGPVLALSAIGVWAWLPSCTALPPDHREARVASSQSVVRAGQTYARHNISDAPSRIIAFDTTEGTRMNVDVSSDGETVVFDLLGDIYALPIAGGDAVPLTAGKAWDQAPRFSLDGNHVYFVSDRIGYKNLWRLTLADESVLQITDLQSDIVGAPTWSQDGDHLLVGVADANTRGTEFILHEINPHNGTVSPINAPAGPWIDIDTFESHRRPIRIFSATESSDGNVFFSQAEYDELLGRVAVRLYKYAGGTRALTSMTAQRAEFSDYKPLLSRGGHLLVYFRQYNDRRTELRVLNRTSAQDEMLIMLPGADDAAYTLWDDSYPNYAFTPDDQYLVLWHNGKIHRVALADRTSTVIPFRVNVEREVMARAQPLTQELHDTAEAATIRWPSLSRDGQTMAFAAIGYVWVMELQTGSIRRLTDSGDFEYMPALSPDGRSVAFVSFANSGDKYDAGRLVIANVDDGERRELIAGANETYLLPSWSQDGSKIAVIRELTIDGNTQTFFGWTPTAAGEFHPVALAPTSGQRANLSIYARGIAFDHTGRRLLFSFPRSRTQTVLASAAVDGGARQTLAIGTSEVIGITPAPDLAHLVLTRLDGTVWLVPFCADAENSQVSTSTSVARKVSNSGGYYVDWNGSTQFTYGFAKNVYRNHVKDSKLRPIRVRVPIPPMISSRPIVFEGARLITMANGIGTGPIIESGTLVVKGKRIAAIGSEGNVVVPADAVVVDVTGKTIMPGFLDTHYHRIGGRGLHAFALPNADFSDRSAIMYGVTTAWEPGGTLNDGVTANVDLQRAGRLLGPRWSHSAMGAVGYPWEQLTSYDAALAAVEQQSELGAVVLKEYNTPTRRQRQWLAMAARTKNLGIVSHLQRFDDMMNRIVDGYSGGDHPYVPAPFFKDVHEMLRNTGYIWTPNVGITSSSVEPEIVKNNQFCDALLAWIDRSQNINEGTKSICVLHEESAIATNTYHRVNRVAKQTAAAVMRGVHIGVSAHSMPGWMLHREMWFLRKGGLPIEDVLRAATIRNAEKLGLQEEIGSLVPGKVADFVVLDNNPLDDILNSLSLTYTVQGGVVYDSNTAARLGVSSVVAKQE